MNRRGNAHLTETAGNNVLTSMLFGMSIVICLFFWTGQEPRNANWLVTCSLFIFMYFSFDFSIFWGRLTLIKPHMPHELQPTSTFWNDLR